MTESRSGPVLYVHLVMLAVDHVIRFLSLSDGKIWAWQKGLRNASSIMMTEST